MIFFGFAPGVGKTYAMLEAARALLARGCDVAAGWIETHCRPDTEALARGIERIPPRQVNDGGGVRFELDLSAYRHAQGIGATWAASERLAVALGPSPTSARLIRATRRMASGLRAPWHGVFVETPTFHHLPAEDRARIEAHLALAAELGGTPVRLQSARVAEALVQFARSENVTQIIVGKPFHPRWRDFLYGSVLNDLLRLSGDIGVYAIEGDAPREAKAGLKGSKPPVTGSRPTLDLPRPKAQVLRHGSSEDRPPAGGVRTVASP